MIIEESVPIPEQRRGGKKYPFAAMKPGDSFFVPGTKAETVAARNAAANYGKRHNWRFTTRWLQLGIRIWRVL